MALHRGRFLAIGELLEEGAECVHGKFRIRSLRQKLKARAGGKPGEQHAEHLLSRKALPAIDDLDLAGEAPRAADEIRRWPCVHAEFVQNREFPLGGKRRWWR